MKLRIHFDNGNVKVLENVVFVCDIKSDNTIMINQEENAITMIKKDEIRSIRMNSFKD